MYICTCYAFDTIWLYSPFRSLATLFDCAFIHKWTWVLFTVDNFDLNRCEMLDTMSYVFGKTLHHKKCSLHVCVTDSLGTCRAGHKSTARLGTYSLLPAGILRCSAAVGREIFQAVARLPSQKAIFRAPKVTNEYTCLKRKVDFRADAKKSKSSFWT